MHAEAEGGFTSVLALIDKAEGKADTLRAAALCELARLLHDTKQHPRAIPAYEQAIDELQRREAPQKDPVGFARIQWDTWSPPGWFDEDEFAATAAGFSPLAGP